MHIRLLELKNIYGNTTEEKVNGEVITSYVYDNKGQVYKKLDNKANKTSVYHYNDADKIIRTEEYIGDSISSKDLESSMQYTYNKTGKLS